MKYLKSIFLLLSLALIITACENTNTAEAGNESDKMEPAVETVKPFGGLALYTLRDTMASNPKGVLKAVADLGYAYVEAAGYKDGLFYGMTPTEFKDLLAGLNLTPISSHNSGITMENMEQTIADVKAAGFKYLVIPVPPMGAFNFDQATRTLSMIQDRETVLKNINLIAEKCAAIGLKCLYHNHDFEFKTAGDEQPIMEYFIENSNPDHLDIQMDLYWVTKAGADPLAYFEKYPGRFKGWHVKDMDDQGRFAPVGTGSIDFGRILAEKEQSGMEFYLVEQDMTFNNSPLEAVAISHQALSEIGFK